MSAPRKANPVTESLRGIRFNLVGKIFYPYLTKMKYEQNKAPKYGAMIAFDPRENQQVVNEIRNLLAKTRQTFHANIPEWTNPLKDYNDPSCRRRDGQAHPDYLRGLCWINASNNEKFPPQVMIVDANAQGGMRPVNQMDEMQIYDGQKVVVTLSFFGLNGENSKWGVSTNLDAVLIAGGGEKIVTQAGGVNVNEAFGSFLQMMNGGGQQAPQGQQQQYNQGQQQYQNNPQYYNGGNLGNGQQYANSANPGQQQYSNHTGHSAHPAQSHGNNGPQQHPNYSQQGNGQAQNGGQTTYHSNSGNQNYNNGYNNGNGGGLV